AMPSSRPSISAPIWPTNETLSVFGSRWMGSPLSHTRFPNCFCSASQKRSRNARTRSIGERSRASLAETGREQRALGTRAAAMLVPATVKQRFNRHAVAHEQSADPLGRIGLVAGDRQQVDAELIHVGRNLADGLGGVGMKQHAALMGDAGAILDRLDGSDLVVGVHDADEDRARRNRSAKVVGINAAPAVNRQIGDASAQALEKPARFDDGGMFDARRDDVIAPLAVRKEHTP